MNKQNNNTKSNVIVHIRTIIGGLMAFVGFILFCLVGMSSSFNLSNLLLVLGIILFVGGLLLAGSIRIIDSFSGMFR